MTPVADEERVISSVELAEQLKKAPKQSFFSSGFHYLDELIGGIGKGDFIVLGGNPGSGKTTLLQTFTRSFAQRKIACLWFSIELPQQEFINRFGENLPIFYLPVKMPNATTHEWIEKKILEAKEKYDVQVVFIDHLGMIVDENVARHQNNIDIFDARIFRLKRFAIANEVAVFAVAPLVQQQLRSKKKEPSDGDFRGTAMIAYTADTLLNIEKLAGENKFTTINESFESVDDFKNSFLVNTDSYLYVVKSRRTGIKKMRVKLAMGDDGDLHEV